MEMYWKQTQFEDAVLLWKSVTALPANLKRNSQELDWIQHVTWFNTPNEELMLTSCEWVNWFATPEEAQLASNLTVANVSEWPQHPERLLKSLSLDKLSLHGDALTTDLRRYDRVVVISNSAPGESEEEWLRARLDKTRNLVQYT